MDPYDPKDPQVPEKPQERRTRWADEDAERAESDEEETLPERMARLRERSGELVGSSPEEDWTPEPPGPESGAARDARVADEAEIDRELGGGSG